MTQSNDEKAMYLLFCGWRIVLNPITRQMAYFSADENIGTYYLNEAFYKQRKIDGN